LVERLQSIVAANNEHPAHTAAPVEIDPELEKQLRALGYIK
jgi:hypothetical protein